MFTADISQLSSRARQAADAADVVAGVRFADALASVTTALPGSSSSATAGQAGSVWAQWRSDWVKQARDYSQAVSAAAADYDAADRQGAVGLSGAGAALRTDPLAPQRD